MTARTDYVVVEKSYGGRYTVRGVFAAREEAEAESKQFYRATEAMEIVEFAESKEVDGDAQ